MCRHRPSVLLDPLGLPDNERLEIREPDTADLEELFDGPWLALG